MQAAVASDRVSLDGSAVPCLLAARGHFFLSEVLARRIPGTV